MPDLPELTEDEHQSLDLLEGLEEVGDAYAALTGAWPASREQIGAAADTRSLLEAIDAEGIEWTELSAARARVVALIDRFVPAVAGMVLQATPAVLEAQRDHLEHGDRVLMAIERATASTEVEAELAWLDATREIPVMALLQDDEAASALTGQPLIEHLRARLDELLEAVRSAVARIDATPAVARGFSPAIAASTQLLAVPRGSLVEVMLRDPAVDPDPELAELGRVITRWHRAAYLRTVADEAPSARPTAPELALFRVASVRGASNEVRARALAGDLPARIAIAREVAKRDLDPVQAIRAFSAAVAAAIAAQRQLEQPAGRRFTRLHLALLLLLLAVTTWHYWLR